MPNSPAGWVVGNGAPLGNWRFGADQGQAFPPPTHPLGAHKHTIKVGIKRSSNVVLSYFFSLVGGEYSKGQEGYRRGTQFPTLRRRNRIQVRSEVEGRGEAFGLTKGLLFPENRLL